MKRGPGNKSSRRSTRMNQWQGFKMYTCSSHMSQETDIILAVHISYVNIHVVHRWFPIDQQNRHRKIRNHARNWFISTNSRSVQFSKAWHEIGLVPLCNMSAKFWLFCPSLNVLNLAHKRHLRQKMSKHERHQPAYYSLQCKVPSSL